MFAARARSAPAAVAARCAGRSLSYAALDARANRLARRLAEAGVGPEKAVAVFVERGFDALVALLGILKTGGVYVPLDTQAPRERLAFVIADVAAAVVVTQGALAHRLPAHTARTLSVDDEDDDAAPAAAGPAPPCVTPSAADAAYCIYTSGSTGRPKGVVVSAGALASHLRGSIAAYGLGPSDRALQFAATSVDAALEQMLAPLCAGASLLLRGEATWSLAELAHAIAAEGVTVADIPTAYWHAFAAEGHAALRATPLRLVIIGGEAALRALRPAPPWPWRVVNAYGPTEATITACLGELVAGDAPLRGPCETIGRPVAGARVHILDEYLTPVPPGVAGELCIGGAHLARGYLGRPELDAEKFVADPFGAPGSRLYRSGDLARWLPDGRIEFLGRIDAQVKVRGFRVEPGEVEGALVACAGVREAVVVAQEDAAGDRRLVAHIVPAPGAAPSIAALEEALRERLPPSLIPTGWSLLDALPRTPGGKIDRRALSAAGPALTAMRTPTTVDAGPVLAAVLAIAAELMPDQAIATDADLIRVGMHSVLILRFVAQCQQRLGVSLKVREVYRLATPAAIAQRVEALAGGAA
jgi:amino acid adenylation domain-containing protein